MADLETPLTRRRALQLAGGLGLAAVIPACASDGGSASPDTTAATTTAEASTETAATAAPDCVLMPELTEGPYYLDLDLVRSDLIEGRPGLPLDLRVSVVDAEACEPIDGAAAHVQLHHALLAEKAGRRSQRRRAGGGDGLQECPSARHDIPLLPRRLRPQRALVRCRHTAEALEDELL